MKAKSVIVIGAGIGDPTAATHLVKRGLHVSVVEKKLRREVIISTRVPPFCPAHLV